MSNLDMGEAIRLLAQEKGMSEDDLLHVLVDALAAAAAVGAAVGVGLGLAFGVAIERSRRGIGVAGTSRSVESTSRTAMLQERAMAPALLTLPKVGRRPVTPQRVLGETISHTGYIIMILQIFVSRSVEKFKAMPAFMFGLATSWMKL